MKPETTDYVLSGRTWARGWNRYEAKTMNLLIGILILALVLGFVIGILLSLQFNLPWFLALVMVLLSGVGMLFVGIVLARAVVPFVWDTLLTKDLEN
jgi:protein-S-isoprenylcysteine O-methyltransferase Ste14